MEIKKIRKIQSCHTAERRGQESSAQHCHRYTPHTQTLRCSYIAQTKCKRPVVQCPALCDSLDCSLPGSSALRGATVFPGKNTGAGCHFLLQRIFPSQGSNLCFLDPLHCRWILYCWAIREAQISQIIRLNLKLNKITWVFFNEFLNLFYTFASQEEINLW